jgi:hypothetical protein
MRPAAFCAAMRLIISGKDVPHHNLVAELAHCVGLPVGHFAVRRPEEGRGAAARALEHFFFVN